jgi:hypothetical protein
VLPSPREEEHAELIDELLRPIDRRREETQRRLDAIADRRAVMPPWERAAAREAAVGLRDDLARFDLLASLVTRMLLPTARMGRPRIDQAAPWRRSSVSDDDGVPATGSIWSGCERSP